jgi:hypothetical protein
MRKDFRSDKAYLHIWNVTVTSHDLIYRTRSHENRRVSFIYFVFAARSIIFDIIDRFLVYKIPWIMNRAALRVQSINLGIL